MPQFNFNCICNIYYTDQHKPGQHPEAGLYAERHMLTQTYKPVDMCDFIITYLSQYTHICDTQFQSTTDNIYDFGTPPPPVQ